VNRLIDHIDNRWRRPELLSLPSAPRGPFGEEPPPWYRRQREAAPSKYSRPVKIACGAVLFTATGTHVHGLAHWLLLAIAAGLPVSALDIWWRARRRRSQEAILSDPEATF
jgi:hypothetical protein